MALSGQGTHPPDEEEAGDDRGDEGEEQHVLVPALFGVVHT